MNDQETENIQATLDASAKIAQAVVDAYERSTSDIPMSKALYHAGLKLIELAVGTEAMPQMLRDSADVIADAIETDRRGETSTH